MSGTSHEALVMSPEISSTDEGISFSLPFVLLNRGILMSSRNQSSTSSRRRFNPAIVLAGAAGSAALAMSMTGTLSAFTASITNSTNTSTAGSLILQEQSSDGKITCLSTSGTDNAATCATINKYGGQTLVAGGTSTTTVNMTNTGTAAATSFTLTPGACVQSGTAPTGVTAATDLCSKATVAVYPSSSATGTPVYSGTLAGFTGAKSLSPLAAGATQAYTFVIQMPASLTNGYQGQQVSQPLTWTLSS